MSAENDQSWNVNSPSLDTTRTASSDSSSERERLIQALELIGPLGEPALEDIAKEIRELLLRKDLIRIHLNVDFSEENAANAQASLDSLHWSAMVLSDPVLLFLTEVASTYRYLSDSVYGMPEGEAYRISRVFDNSQFVEHSKALEDFVRGGGLQSQDVASEQARSLAIQIAYSISQLNSVLARRDELGLLDLANAYSLDQFATLALKALRHQVVPKIVKFEPGSLVATVLAAGPSLLVVIGAVSAKSLIRKANSEAKKADADAALSLAQARKSASECSVIRLEVLSKALDVLDRVESAEDHMSNDQREALSLLVVNVFAEVNPAVVDPSLTGSALKVAADLIKSSRYLVENIERVEAVSDAIRDGHHKGASARDSQTS